MFLCRGGVAEQLNNQWKKQQICFLRKALVFSCQVEEWLCITWPHFLCSLCEYIKSQFIFFLCVSKVFLPLSFFVSLSFMFLVSDSSSSSSLSRTESPLHLFVSSHLHSHPKPDTFVWPPAAHSVSDPGPRQEPSLCKHGLWFFPFLLDLLHLPDVLFSDNLPNC